MPRNVGPERKHFGGENGLICETVNGVSKYFWRCIYCEFQLGGKVLPNKKARIHLSGDPTLRNAIISKVCPNAPDHVKKQFVELEKQKRQIQVQTKKQKKRQRELLQPKLCSPPTKQSKLCLSPVKVEDDVVDDAWAEAFFGLDIAGHKIGTPLFRDAIVATQRSKPG